MSKKNLSKKMLMAATIAGAFLLSAGSANADDPTPVNDWGGLKSGLQSGSNMSMTDNITVPEVLEVSGKNNTIMMNGNTLTGSTSPYSGISTSGGSLTIENGGTFTGFNRPDTTPASVSGNEYGIIDVRGNSGLTMTGGDWTFSGNTSGVGSINALNSSVSATVDSIVFENNISNAQGAGLRHQVSDIAYINTNATITANEITFNNNEIKTVGELGTAVVGGGGAVMNSGGTMKLLGGTNTFTNNKMNATIAESRRYKVGGGAVINQSHQMGSGDEIVSTMVIGKTDGSSTNTFTGNTSSTSGGAVMNRAVDKDGNAYLTINGNTTFENNTAAQNGGAIYNVRELLTAAANEHTANITISGNTTFTGNETVEKGGAIYNSGNMTIANGTFTKNVATGIETNHEGRGGAIYNTGSEVIWEKPAQSQAGFSYNGVMNISNTNFGVENDTTSGNSALQGGAIFNNDENALAGSITLNNVNFYNNKTIADTNGDDGYTSSLGGAIYNAGDMTINGDVIFKGNTAEGYAAMGGAIHNGYGDMTFNDEVTFDSNKADKTIAGNGAQGGAINNEGTMTFKDAVTFTGNQAVNTLEPATASLTYLSKGGAIHNNKYGVTPIITFQNGATFENNQADIGGAIYNNQGTINLTNATFTDNNANADGGAIFNYVNSNYSSSIINLAGTTTFSGNTAGDDANDIYNLGTLNIGGTATLNGGIDGTTNGTTMGLVNITDGITTIGANLKNQTVAVNGGELWLKGVTVEDETTATDLTGSAVTVASGAIINTIDNTINDYATGGEGKGTITLADGAIIKGDINYIAGSADKYTASSGTVTYTLGNLIGDVSGGEKEIQVVTGGATVNANDATFTTDKGLQILTADTAGYIKVKGLAGGINTAVDTTTDEGGKSNVNYTVTTNETFDGNGGTDNVIANSNFTINGKGTDTYDPAIKLAVNMINGDATKSSTLTLNDAKFTTENASELVNTAGSTLYINDSLIGVTIHNYGTLFSDPTTYTARQINDGTETYSGDTFHNITATGQNGGGLYNTGILTVQKDSDNNKPTFDNNTAAKGGAIYNTKAKVGDDIVVNISDAVFTNNSATGDGGAIYNTGAMSITNSTFGGASSGNSAGANGYGGAIENSGILNIENSTFANNSALEAGAIDNYGGTVTISGTSNFAGNSATSSAGAIYNTGAATLNISGTTTENTTFDGNSAANGGAIFNAGTMTQNYGTYQNNTATSKGGAIYSGGTAGTRSLSMTGVTFDTNSAAFGGAIFAASSSNTLNNVTFNGNTASSSGGGIYVYEDTTLGVSNNSTFTSNTAEYGGAIYNKGTATIEDSIFGATSQGNTAEYGGAIYHYGVATTVYNSQFVANSATSAGGAIASGTGIDGLTINGSEFTSNTAVDGGAVAAYGDVDIIGSTFTSNSASNTAANGGGGAVFVGQQSAANIINSSFTSNTSDGYGGAIATRNNPGATTSLNITGDGTTDTDFYGNSAVNGGAIYTDAATTIANTNFTNNTATTAGGAIYSDAHSVLAIIADGKDVEFTDNTANGVANDIYNSGQLEFIATGTKSITFNGGITGGGDININSLATVNSYKDLSGTTIVDVDLTGGDPSVTKTAGAVVFNGDVSADDLSIAGGTLTNNLSKTLTVAGNLSVADAAGAVFNNNGALSMTGGDTTTPATITGTIGGSGSTTIDGIVKLTNTATSYSTIAATQGLTISSEKSLIANVAGLPTGTGTSAIDNDGTLTLFSQNASGDASTYMNRAVSGDGKTVFNRNVTINADIENEISIASYTEGTDTFNANVIVADGNKLGVSGKAITVDANNSLTMENASDLQNDVTNSGNLTLQGGDLTKSVAGATKGTTNVTGDTTFKNGVTLGQKELNVESGVTLTNENGAQVKAATTNVYGTVDNSGIIDGALTNNGGTVTNYIGTTDGEIKGNIVNNSGSIISNAGKLATGSTSTITNDGTITLNGGTLSKVIDSITSGAGTVEIDSSGIVIVGATGGITNSKLELTNGTLDLAAVTGETSGDIDFTNATGGANVSIIAGNGVMSVQDGKTGAIALGAVDTGTFDKKLNVAIDTNFATDTRPWEDHGIIGHADVISATVTGDKGIHISDIRMTADPIATEMKAQIATDGAIAKIDVTDTTISNMSEGAGSLFLSYDSATGYLTAVHETLDYAITSTIPSKMYAMTADETVHNGTGALPLGGTSLSITGNGYDITGQSATEDGIKIANSGQTLSITGTHDTHDDTNTVISGFKTAIDNTAGGTVNLKDVTMSGNTTDVDNSGANAGIVNLNGVNASNIINDGEDTKGVFLSGTNNITKIADTGEDHDAGQTTVSSGSSTIGTLIQKAVNVLEDGTLNIGADKLITTDGTANAGTLNLSGSDDPTNPAELASVITGTGQTNISDNVSTEKNIDQGTVYVGIKNGSAANASLTLNNDATVTADDIRISTKGTVNANADKLVATNGINNQGTLNLSGDDTTPTEMASKVTGSKGTTNIVSGKVTTDKNITQKAVNVGAGTELTTSAKIDAKTTTVDGTLVNNGGTIASGTNNKVVVNNGGTFENSGNVGADIDNSGTLNNTGNITSNSDVVNKAGGIINNIGSGKINHLTNNAADTSTTPETPAGIVNTTADGIVAYAVNNGVLNLSGTTTPDETTTTTATITGDNGTTNIKAGNVTFGKNVTQQAINVEAGTNLVNDARINAATTTVDGSLVNNDGAIIASADGTNNKVVVSNTGSLANAGAIGADIDNSGYVSNTGLVTAKSSVTNNSGATIDNTGSIKGVITNAGEGVDPVTGDPIAAAVLNTTASGIQGGVINDGVTNVNGTPDAEGNPEILGSDITAGTNGTGKTNITGDVATNATGKGSQIVDQDEINIGTDDGTTVVPGSLDNAGTLDAATVNVTADSELDNSGNIYADDIKNAGTTNFNDGYVEADNIITDNSGDTDAATNFSGGDVDADNITNNGGTNTFDGADVEAGAITNNDGTTSIEDGSVDADTIENVAGDTNIIGGDVTADDIINSADNGTLNINQTTIDPETGEPVSTGSVIADAITNSGSGNTEISSVVEANTVASTGEDGIVNLNATPTDTSTSDLISNANVTIADGATVAVTTDADNYSVDNAVTGTGAAGTGALDLNGVDTSGYQTADDSQKTKFTIDNAVDNTVVNVNEGQLDLADESNLTNSTVHVAGPSTPDGNDAATVNTKDGNSTKYTSNEFEFEDQAEVKFDVDAKAKNSDRFENNDTAVNPDNQQILTDISLQNLDKIVRKNTNINLKDTSNLSGLTVSDELQGRKFQAMTPIRIMEATINAEGMMNIHPSSGRNDYDSFNPAAVVSVVAAQLGGYLSQLNSYDEAFRNLDMKMLMTQEERKAMKMANSYASEVRPQVFSETYLPEKDSAGWFRPYASFEKVNLQYGPNAENNMYGSYFGGDSKMYETKNGWDYQYSVYVGYNGSHQNFQRQSIYQNGGNIGATGIWYKGDFFTALTANVGASVANASTTFGNEDFAMLMTGVASKTGYNWELAKGKFIIQPNYLMSYTFVNTFDYTNAAGVRINTKPLNAINIAPGVKFIGNLKNGWQPYVSLRMVWNVMDKADFHANDIPLPEMSVKPYFQYGLGLQKRWGDRFTGFGQLMFRNGGRNGIAMSAGFRWAIGKEYTERTAARRAQKGTVIKQQQKKDQNIKNVNNSVSFNNNSKGFFSKMDGEPTYVVKVPAKI